MGLDNIHISVSKEELPWRMRIKNFLQEDTVTTVTVTHIPPDIRTNEPQAPGLLLDPVHFEKYTRDFL